MNVNKREITIAEKWNERYLAWKWLEIGESSMSVLGFEREKTTTVPGKYFVQAEASPTLLMASSRVVGDERSCQGWQAAYGHKQTNTRAGPGRERCTGPWGIEFLLL